MELKYQERILPMRQALCLISLLLFSFAVRAEEASGSVFPLGSIGGTASCRAKDPYLDVKTLTQDAPGAYGGLRAGDRIVAADGVAFGPAEENSSSYGKGPLEALGTALDRAEGGDGTLKLTVLRDGKKTDITLTVPKLGAYAATFPFDCPKSKAFYDDLCKHIAAAQGRDGGWGGGEVTSAYSALALMARRDAKYKTHVEKWANAIVGKFKKREDFPRGGCSNWGIAFNGIFLGEYYWSTKDKKVLPTLQLIVDELASRQTDKGLYGHSEQPVYGGNGLTVVGSAVLWCWGMARKCGVNVPHSNFDRLVAYLKTSCGHSRDGKEAFIGYNHTCVDIGQSIARTSHTVLGLTLAGVEEKWVGELGRHLTSHTYLTLECHAVACPGMGATIPAQTLSNPAGLRKHLDAWKWYFTLARKPDGNAGYIPSRGNIGGDSYLNFQNIMNATTALSLGAAEQNLCMHGRFLDIPGLAAHALSPRLQKMYDALLKKEITPGLVGQLESAAGTSANAEPADSESAAAAKMLAYVKTQVLQPALDAARKNLTDGDPYGASECLDGARKDYGKYITSLEAYQKLSEQLQTQQNRSLVATGSSLRTISAGLERAMKPANRLYGGRAQMQRLLRELEEFAEKQKDNIYGKRAQELLKKISSQPLT
jgi:hypothetical protein